MLNATFSVIFIHREIPFMKVMTQRSHQFVVLNVKNRYLYVDFFRTETPIHLAFLIAIWLFLLFWCVDFLSTENLNILALLTTIWLF